MKIKHVKISIFHMLIVIVILKRQKLFNTKIWRMKNVNAKLSRSTICHLKATELATHNVSSE